MACRSPARLPSAIASTAGTIELIQTDIPIDGEHVRGLNDKLAPES